jgi:hypothetical protein
MVFLLDEYIAGIQEFTSPKVARERVGSWSFHHPMDHSLYHRSWLNRTVGKREGVGKWRSDKGGKLTNGIGSSRATGDMDIAHRKDN